MDVQKPFHMKNACIKSNFLPDESGRFLDSRLRYRDRIIQRSLAVKDYKVKDKYINNN